MPTFMRRPLCRLAMSSCSALQAGASPAAACSEGAAPCAAAAALPACRLCCADLPRSSARKLALVSCLSCRVLSAAVGWGPGGATETP